MRMLLLVTLKSKIVKIGFKRDFLLTAFKVK